MKTERLHIRVDKYTADSVRRLAKKRGVSVGSIVSDLIKREVINDERWLIELGCESDAKG